MKKYILVLSAILIASSVALSQSVSKAEKQMSLYNYSGAIRILTKALDNPKMRTAALPLLAECYRMQHDMFNAKVWYGQALNLKDPQPEWYFYYAQALQATGDYEKAKEVFLKYAKMNPGDPRGPLYASYCDTVMVSWKGKAPRFEVRPVSGINSAQSDFGPAFFGGQLVFASDRITEIDESSYGWTGRGYLDILCSSPDAPNEFWGDMKTPSSFKGKFNQTFHDGPACFGNNVVYFTRSYRDAESDQKKTTTNLLKIFYSTYENGKWGAMEAFFLNSPDYSVGHPALSPNGSVICFVSDMPGGQGGTDLWICRNENGGWGKPENLGAGINTPGNEMFPSIQSDGSLIYSSDMLPGYGGLDIYQAMPSKDKWSDPVNLGLPLNSSFDDFAMNYAPGADNGFFSTNRPGGIGSDDIYAFRKISIPEPVITKPVEVPKPTFIAGTVKDKVTKLPVEGASVFVYNPNEGKVHVLKTDHDGNYKLEIDRAAKLVIKAMKPNYIADCLPFELEALKPGSTMTAPRELLLDKLEVNKTFKVENIYYDFDKFNIREDAKPELDKLVRIMKENAINVELGSHTDSRGSFSYNDKLSQNRAQSAVDYIVSQGISSSRITAKGYGERQLVNTCSDGVKCTDEEHQANRRTEFKVTSFAQNPQLLDQFDPDKFMDGEALDSRLLPGGFFGTCK